MKRYPLPGLDVFLSVARHGSLRAAAADRGVRPSAISQQLKALEIELGAPLFVRSTRSIRLTDAGELLLMRAQPAMANLVEGLEEIRALSEVPSGILKITVPEFALKLVLMPKLLEFQKAYPNVTLEVSVDDGLVDIISKGFHAGIRSGHQLHEDMVAVRLTPPLKDAFFAAPSYLDLHGRPKTPEDLAEHTCIIYRYVVSKRLERWRFLINGEEVEIPVSGRMIVNNTSFLLESTLAGYGIASFYEASIRDHVREGRLEHILKNYVTEYPGIYLYFPKSLQKLRRLRVFIDWFAVRAGQEPWAPID
ncbi:LysR family transcriptional regulator [Terrihabitans soli]|uniref:LysR family transcriptional regulator n=1 Tax=Terrihabitans soli TaxID=708113 RepID=A0A6S6QQS1_9HYPH|nr:LysR family transcriptional regulator [Terrihabitans soli]BCJ90317.1 LysR family transcriptional regulator [Terrihabitans soli]